MSGTQKYSREEIDWRIRVFDSLSFPTLILQPNKVIVSANQVFLETYQDQGRIIGKKCHEVFYPTEAKCPIETCPLVQVIETKQGNSILRRVVNSKGQERWEDRVFSSILDEYGEVMYIMESVRDVTATKILERELEETKTFFENVLQSSPSAILAADRTGKLLFMNQAAEVLWGYTMEQVRAKLPVESMYPPSVARALMKKMRDGDSGGKGKLPPSKINVVNSKGEEIPTEATAAIIYEDEREVATMGIYNDLREKIAVEKKLKETQNQLAQSEKMASMGQLAAGVAHEINNPLGGIMLYANLALESIDEKNPLYEDLKYIIEDTNRCREIVKNLLAYSRQTSPTKKIVPINELVEQSLLLLRDPVLFGNIIINKELSNEMILINSDKEHLTQVIINLLMNAAAAMNGDGTLTLRTYRDKAARKAYIEVADTGCGIPEENRDKVFDPFFTTKEPGKGTGLGLSTGYGIVKENGGEIYIKETSSLGTTFVVELPLFTPSKNNGMMLT